MVQPSCRLVQITVTTSSLTSCYRSIPFYSISLRHSFHIFHQPKPLPAPQEGGVSGSNSLSNYYHVYCWLELGSVYTLSRMYIAISGLQAHLSVGFIFPVEELKVPRREMTQESQISARGRVGARTDLRVLFEASPTTPPLPFSRAGLRQCSDEHTQAGLGQVPLTRQSKGHFLCNALLTPLGQVVIYLEITKLT